MLRFQAAARRPLPGQTAPRDPDKQIPACFHPKKPAKRWAAAAAKAAYRHGNGGYFCPRLVTARRVGGGRLYRPTRHIGLRQQKEEGCCCVCLRRVGVKPPADGASWFRSGSQCLFGCSEQTQTPPSRTHLHVSPLVSRLWFTCVLLPAPL